MIDYVNFDLFNDSSVDKQLTLTFSNGDVVTNDDIESQSMELTESINSEQQMTFGLCEASEFKITIHNVFASHVGQTVTVSMVLDGDTANPFTIGTYDVFSDNVTADRQKREIIAYDGLFNVLNTDVANWYNNTVFPSGVTTRKLSWIRASLMSHFGITEETVTLPNDDMDVSKTISPTTLSGKDMLKSICEINARFGHIGRDNKFHYIKLKEIIPGLYPANTLYPDDDLYPRSESGAEVIGEGGNYISCDYEDYEIQRIDKLIIRQEDGDVGVTVGAGSNPYIIQGNFLVYGKSAADLTTIGNNIYDDMHGIYYRPSEIEIVGNPCYEVGDGLRLQTTYDVVYAYIFKRVLKGIQALRDTYTCDGPEYRNSEVNSVSSQLVQLAGKTASLKVDVDGIAADVEDLAEQTSTSIQQLSDSVAVKVNSQGHVVTSLDLNTNGMSFSGDKVVFNTSNFKLDAQGNATFSGRIESTGTGGDAVIDNGLIEANHISVSWGGTPGVDGLYITDAHMLTSEDDYEIALSGSNSLINVTGDIKKNGYSVLTTNDSVSYATSAGSAASATNATYASKVGNSFYNAYISANDNFIPNDVSIKCGTGTNYWQDVCGYNAYTQTSDEREKKDIKKVDKKYLDFILKLAPRSFLMKRGTSGRTHIGFIAQEVEALMEKCNITSLEFAGLCKEPTEDGDYVYSLRYGEFIGLILMAVQSQEERLTAIENKLYEMGVE